MFTSRLSGWRFLLVAVLALGAVSVASAAPILVSIDPRTTFLRTDAGDSYGVYFVDFSALGINAGDTLYLQTLGDFCMSSGAGCTEYAVPLIAAFASTNTLGDRANLNRLTAIASAAPGVVTGNTYYETLTTDISQDFAIPVGSPMSVVVPAGALYLAVGVTDSWYTDNSDPDRDLQLQLDVSRIPEPGTVVLLASGFGLLVAFRRRRA